MHNITLPVSELPIMGHMENDDFVQEHLATWEQEVLEKLEPLGYPLSLWPSDMKAKAGFIRYWKGTGFPRTMAPIDTEMDKTPYNGPKMHESVMRTFSQSFPVAQTSLFCITRGEDWWPYDKAFACINAETFMRSIHYMESARVQHLLEAPAEKRGRGRPSGDKVVVDNSERKARYLQWLADCEDYRIRCAELKDAYMVALKEYTEWKERGAPKWTP